MTKDPTPSNAKPYEPPAVRRLGTLLEFTRGGTAGTVADGNGYAGSSGTI
jgi:hypothetical protein